ncbi:MAG: hypothetical protein M1165_00375 [Candidatus Pacearchaeota archaeon]|nr:hypothetical protein [Candidatus Pacearchaeota archaeon]MDE1848425.1 hypothetical protein [Nanoarchaeota archaeon]
MKGKRGMTLLLENVIFIILNVIFIAILIFFLISKSTSGSVLEEKYAKEIALALDAAHPGMQITINMADAIKVAEANLGVKNLGQAISFNENIVTVKLRDNGGYSYSFFNNVTIINSYIDNSGNYVLFVGDYHG